MKKLFILIFIAAGIHSAMAMGVGISGSYVFNSVDYTYNYNGATTEKIGFHHGQRWQAGLVFDSNVAKDFLVSYRLNLGYGKSYRSLPGDDLDMHEFNMYHTICFGIIRNRSFRFWIGPEIGYGIAVDKDSSRHVEAFGLLGVSIGLNIHFSKWITVIAEIGGRYGLFAGDTAGIDRMYGPGYEVVADFGVLFRFDDEYIEVRD